MILVTLVTGLIATFTDAIALGQSPDTLVQHRTINLTSQKITLPFGNKTFAGNGEEVTIVNEHCLLCHSKGMIDTQPPLTLESWKNEVDKMRTAYGCPLRADQTAGVAEFISHAENASAAGGN
ncbi:MAG: hypothetical protein WB580_21780 [Candidatus Binataceae bacterium]